MNFADTRSTFANILFATLNLGFEFLGKFKLIFEHVFQPITQGGLVRFGQLLHFVRDLFQRRHDTIKTRWRQFASLRRELAPA